MKKLKKVLLPMLGVSLLATSVTPAAVQAQESMSQVETPAVELRGALDHLLSEHFVLAVKAMQTQYDGAPGADEAQAALEQNAADMEPAIASIYGEEGGAEFNRIFSAHNQYTADYVQAVKDGDEQAQQEAEDMLDSFYGELASFLATATEGNLPEEAAFEVLDIHEEQVADAFDAYVAGDYETVYMTYREGLSHMFDISAALSGAITTQNSDTFKGTATDTDAANLRSDLSASVAEHFALATLGMNKEFNEASDFDFVSWAEDENTADIKAAFASIYGEEGGEQFETIWQGNHIVAQSEYVTAAKNNDEDGKQAAIDKLHTFADEFGEFLGTATEGNLPKESATDIVNMHEEQVINTFELYVNEDYTGSVDQFREGYAFTFEIGKGLAGAIVAQHPDMFEEEAMPEMPKTGMGGMSKALT
ncbi:copper amine oxidase [Bacillus sp. JCM 19041]|uniref:copper amine oxidase n=1 Tax=Bacillus sp. JCM 19041 TaxID=1460637 RepID=UPI000A91FC08